MKLSRCSEMNLKHVQSTGAPRQMPVTPEYGSTGGGQMGGQTGAGQMGGGQMGSHPIGQDSEVDTPFGA